MKLNVMLDLRGALPVFATIYEGDRHEVAFLDQIPVSPGSYYAAAYLFEPVEPYFCDALAIWSMFYLQKTVTEPHKKFVKAINAFVGDDVLKFKSY